MGSRRSGDSMSSDGDELPRRSSIASEDDDDEYDDADSGAGSDDFDLLELGESGSEFCQVGDQACCIPSELYDLPDLREVLSLEVWNECLTEEERFDLTKYLPDMDVDTFMHALKELFQGYNFHFGSPVNRLFKMLKGGLCEPRVALYRQGLNFFQRCQHHHMLRNYQDNMVTNLLQIRDAWQGYKGHGIQEKLRVLNLTRSQKNIMHEKARNFETDSSEREGFGDYLGGKGSKRRSTMQKVGRDAGYWAGPPNHPLHREKLIALESLTFGKRNKKGLPKLKVSKLSSQKRSRAALDSGPYDSKSFLKKHRSEDDMEEALALRGDQYVTHSNAIDRNDSIKSMKKRKTFRTNEYLGDGYTGMPMSSKVDHRLHDQKMNVSQLSDFKFLKARPSNMRNSYDPSTEGNYLTPAYENHFISSKGRTSQVATKGNRPEFSDELYPYQGKETLWQLHSSHHGSHKSNSGKVLYDINLKSVRNSLQQMNGSAAQREKRSKLQEKIQGDRSLDGIHRSRKFFRDEETESDSSDQFQTEDDGNHLVMSELKSRDRPFVSKAGYDKKGKPVQRDQRKKPVTGMPPSSSVVDAFVGHSQVIGSDPSPIGCSSVTKKRKQKKGDVDKDRQDEADFLQSTQQQLDEPISLKNQSKKKPEADRGFLDIEFLEPEPKDTVIAAPQLEPKPQKTPFIPITPTVHTSFSFSVVHLLSAVRMALIAPNPEDSLDAGKHLGKTDDSGVKAVQSLNENKAEAGENTGLLPGNVPSLPSEDLNEKQAGEIVGSLPGNVPSLPIQGLNENQTGENTGSLPGNVRSLTLQELVDRVRSNPRDPCILETREPLQELVTGVLKILSSRTAPLGAKSWKPLVQFEKLTKSWYWVGPAAHSSPDHEICEEVVSPEAWGVPHKLLVKLVDAFANWLKSGQETSQQLGSLPAPPVDMMLANLDEKERFKDLRAQKSLATINPSSEEVRAYFRKEEELRYLVPDRAFSYTAADGKKSIVAPLRRGGGKPSSKARDHVMLKKDRPPHVTILCLVRDAAARLPGSIGTRADVCTLIRDSQYIVEDISDAKVNHVVSGALDRLHYERDPSVQFDGGRKLWVYLHRDRVEEDFEDDGTSSTKKWKKPKKDATVHDEGTSTMADHGIVEQTGFDLTADLNLEPPSAIDDNPVDVMHFDTIQRMGNAANSLVLPMQGAVDQAHPMVWEILGFNPMQDNKLFCQENTTTQEFDGDSFGLRQV
ncbi:Nuclear factor related to kappa-B-binding protein-like protein [Drosera capensis]